MKKILFQKSFGFCRTSSWLSVVCLLAALTALTAGPRLFAKESVPEASSQTSSQASSQASSQTASSQDVSSNDDGLFPFSVEGESLSRLWTPQGPAQAGSTGQIHVQGDVFTDDSGKPMRFWGTNLPFDSNFPEKPDAERLAKRLRTFGMNCVRLHFVDTRIWGKYEKEFGHRRMDEEQLDRFDWFLYQLKRNGIYANINLHVGRTLDERDGNFPEANRLRFMQKGIDNFMPEMIELQKEYARNLLTHVNPYTKMSYAKDPGVAFIEINNENSVVCEWSIGNLDDLPEFYVRELETRWNAWLRERFTSTKELRKRWGGVSEPLGEEMIPDGSFTRAETFRQSPWNLEKDSQTVAEVEPDETSQTLKIHVTQPSKSGWNPQFYLQKAHVEADVPYQVRFRIRSTVPKNMVFYFMENHEPWRSLLKPFTVSSEWQTVEMLLTPNFTDSNVRLGFAQLAGEVEIDDFSVRRGGTIGLTEGESLETASIRFVPQRSDVVTKAQKRDFRDFLMDLDLGYWRKMFAYLKNDLRVHAPVAGTQLRYASAHAQAELDYCDIHEYWCHPYWLHKKWDPEDWIVTNRSFVNVLSWASSSPALANYRILGKPFTLSEFNQPNPNFYAAEAFPITACVGAFQNWSAVYSYCWAHTKNHRDSNLFFDLCENPHHLVHHPACVNLFVRGDVRSVETLPEPPMAIAEITRKEEYEITAQELSGYHRSYAELGQARHSVLEAYCGIRLPDLKIPHSLTDSVPALNASPGWKADPAVNSAKNGITKIKSPTGELSWDGTQPGKAFFLADTPKTKLFTGFIAGRTFTFQDGTLLKPGENRLDWATISLTQTSENHWLLATTGVMKNSNATYRPYDEPEPANVTDLRLLEDRPVISQPRGTLPRLCEPIALQLVLPVSEDQNVAIFPLDGSANRLTDAAARSACEVKRLSPTQAEIRIAPTTRTIWYEIEFSTKK